MVFGNITADLTALPQNATISENPAGSLRHEDAVRFRSGRHGAAQRRLHVGLHQPDH